MENTSYVAVSAQVGLRRRLDLTANNIANANTDGFKADRMRFKEIITQPPRTDRITFNGTANIGRDLTIGSLRHTGNPLDVALQGEGYFIIETDNGLRYSRLGRFAVSDENFLVNPEGQRVLDETNAPIAIPVDTARVTIAKDGVVLADDLAVGQLGVVDFDDPQALVKIGDNLYSVSDEEPQEPLAVVEPSARQFHIESSNVEPIKEMVTLIDVHRRYAAIERVIKDDDSRRQRAIDQLTRIT